MKQSLKNIVCVLFFISISFSSSFAQGVQNIGGIGAQLFIDTAGGYTLPRIQSFVANSPASQSLKVTDYILKVDGVSCKDKTIEDVVGMIRGIAGTTVKITVSHDKAGKFAEDFNLQRVSIQVAVPDPAVAFNADCENEVAQLKNKGFKIIKTFNSDCGDYFFNFDAEKQLYHVRVITLEPKTTTPYKQGFYATAKVFDNDHEEDKTELPRLDSKDIGNAIITQLEGALTFKRDCIGVVSVQIHDDVKKCGAMYVIVYK